jgi:hypothetical protein
MAASDPFSSVSNNNSRKDAKALRNDYHVSINLRVFALRLREKNYCYLFGRSWPISEVLAVNH